MAKISNEAVEIKVALRIVPPDGGERGPEVRAVGAHALNDTVYHGAGVQQFLRQACKDVRVGINPFPGLAHPLLPGGPVPHAQPRVNRLAEAARRTRGDAVDADVEGVVVLAITLLRRRPRTLGALAAQCV